MWSSIIRTGIVAILVIGATALAESKKQARGSVIRLQKVPNNQAYARKASSKPHVNIKVRPPKLQGPGQFLYIEIYNETKQPISKISFSLDIESTSMFELDSEISADDLLPGRSSVRKIKTPGKGPFPKIDKVRPVNLQIINQEAKTIYPLVVLQLLY